MAEVSHCTTSNCIILSNCRFSFGAYGTKHPLRATKVEEFFTGKVLSVGVLYEAVKLLGAIVVPEFAHTTISRCLGIPEHNVRVITRRVGGGFGGKGFRAMPVSI